MVSPSTMSASLHLLWIRNRNTNVLGLKTRMLLNAAASLIRQNFFLMFIPAKTNAVVTESLPGAALSGWFCKDRNLRRDFWLAGCAHRHGIPQNPLCKTVLQIQVALLPNCFCRINKKCILKSKMPVCLRSQGCEPT